MLNKLVNLMPNLRYFEGEEGGGGYGGSGDAGMDSGGGEQQATQGGSEGGLNPAWNPLLEKLPSSLHGMVTPHLREWDQNYQRDVQKVQSQYEPYNSFLEAGVDPEVLQAAYQLYQLTEQDPERIYNELGKFYGYGGDQGQDGQEELEQEDGWDGEDITQHPRFQELAQNQEAMAQLLMAQHEQEQMAQAEQQVDQEITSIKEKHPDMSVDEEIMMLNVATQRGINLEEAADIVFQYNESITQRALQGQPHAPRVMSATGSIPGAPPIDPAKLDAKGRKELVANILASRNQ
jgi:hypothetical protein